MAATAESTLNRKLAKVVPDIYMKSCGLPIQKPWHHATILGRHCPLVLPLRLGAFEAYVGRWDPPLELPDAAGAPNKCTAAQSEIHAARLYSEVYKCEAPIALYKAAVW